MNICITGGAGFIGSHLANALLKDGHSVAVIDNFASGNAGNVSSDARIIRCDITEADLLKKAMHGFDAVYHMAAQTDVRFSDADTDYKINVEGTRNVADCSDGAKIIFASSCAVYGNCSGNVPEDSGTKPLSGYARNKLLAEKLLPESAFIARLFNVYGHRGNSFVNKACEAALRNKKIMIFGSGMQTRDYVHVDDVVAALIKGMELSGIYNIGTGKESSVLSVVHMVENAGRNRIKTEFTPSVEGEIERSVADITKMRREGWEPKISLEEGIRMLLK